VDWTDHLGPILIAFSDDYNKTPRTKHDVKAAHRASHLFTRPYDHSGGNLDDSWATRELAVFLSVHLHIGDNSHYCRNF